MRYSSSLMTAALLAGVLASSASAQVDLHAALMNGAELTYANATAIATIAVDNVGDPLAGDYTAEVILTDDLVVDPGDRILRTLASNVLGPQTITVDVPSDVPSGKYVWVLRVQPAAGETNLANNVVFGSVVNVVTVDVALNDPSPITAFVAANDERLDPITVTVTVDNVGTPGSIVVFTIEALAAAPWLQIEPPSSFAIAGQPGNDIELILDHTGLESGTYSTTVRFTNYQIPEDVEDLEVTLTVGPARFEPGDKFRGQISLGGDTDEITFVGVKGERVGLDVRATSGDLRPRLTFIDQDGVVERIITWKHSDQYVKKTHKLKRSGEYAVIIDGAAGTFGAYTVKTGRKMPKLALSRVVKVKNPNTGPSPLAGFVSIPVRLLPGATLEFSADRNGAFAGPLVVGLVKPDGGVFDVNPFMTIEPSGDVTIGGVAMDEAGEFGIAIGGFGPNKKEKVKVRVLPVQPPQGRGRIYLK